MTLHRTKLPLSILALIVVLITVKVFFSSFNKPTLHDDGSVSYKKSGVGDDYLYKINDTIAFQAHLLPTMGAIAMDVVSYKQVGGIEGFMMGNNRMNVRLFSPSEKKGDWIYTSYAKPGDYYAVNTQTGELLQNKTTDDNLYETEFYQARFSGGQSLKDNYILQNFDYISTYKSSGADLLMAGVFLAGICLIWALIALLLDLRKPRTAKPFVPQQHAGSRAPSN
jgi:hypothetical protein